MTIEEVLAELKELVKTSSVIDLEAHGIIVKKVVSHDLKSFGINMGGPEIRVEISFKYD